MKRKVLLILVDSLFSICACAQEFSLGPMYEVDSKHYEIGLLTKADSGWNLSIYDDHNGESWTFNEGLQRLSTEKADDVKRRSDFIYHYRLGDTNGYVYRHSASMNRQEIWLKHDQVEDPIKLVEFDKIRGKFPRLRFKLTNEGILAWYETIQIIDDAKSVLQFVLYSGQGIQLLDWQLELNKPPELVRPLRLDVQQSRVLLTAKEYNKSPVEKRAFKSNYSYVLYSFALGSRVATTHLLHPEGLFPNLPLIHITQNELIAFCYAGIKKVDKLKYLSVTRIGLETDERKNALYDLIDLDIPRNAFTYRWLSKSFVGLRALDVQTTDTGWTLISEFRSYRAVGNSASGPVINYIFGPLLIIGQNDSDPDIKSALIEKYHHSVGDDATHLSFKSFQTDSSTVFLHNRGHFYLLGRPWLKSVFRKSPIQVTEVLRKDLSTEVIIIPRDKKWLTPHWMDASYRDGEIIVPVSGKKQIGLGVFRY